MFSKIVMINNYKNIGTGSVKNEIINKYSWERSANQVVLFLKDNSYNKIINSLTNIS